MTTYAALQTARAAYEAALVATFGDAADHMRWAGPWSATDYPALAAAYEAVRLADKAHYTQFAARTAA